MPLSKALSETHSAAPTTSRLMVEIFSMSWSAKRVVPKKGGSVSGSAGVAGVARGLWQSSPTPHGGQRRKARKGGSCRPCAYAHLGPPLPAGAARVRTCT